MAVDSVKKRYLANLFANSFKIIVGVLNSTIVPRSLGVISYGNYNFLISIASSIRSLVSLGTENAFYTYSSKQEKSGAMFFIYYGWFFFQLAAVLLFVSAVVFFGFKENVFPGQHTKYIIIITGLEWLNAFAISFIRFGESKAESILVQKVNIISSFFRSAAFVCLFKIGILTLDSYIIVGYACSLIISFWIIFSLVIPKKNIYIGKYDRDDIKKAFKYFILYCTPLIVYQMIGLAGNFFDRWFLQTISGSVEQAYFSIAYQWCAISILFATSMHNVFWREISYSFGKDNKERQKRIYLKSSFFVFFCPAL